MVGTHRLNTRYFQFLFTCICISMGISMEGCVNNGTPVESDWKKENLKDKVKYIRTVIYSASNNKDTVIRGEEIRPNEEFYNNSGMKTEIIKYYSEGLVNQKEAYEFDKSFRLINKKVYTADNHLRFRVQYTYDANGNETEVVYYDYKNTVTNKMLFTYDSFNHKIEEVNYINGDSLAYRKTFKNDQNGRKIEEFVYNSNGELGHTTKYKYDAHGNETELKYFNPDKTANMIIKYHYDTGQNRTDEVFYRPDSLIARWNYEYIFDDKGNWTTKTRFMNNNALDIFERKIEYFK